MDITDRIEFLAKSFDVFENTVIVGISISDKTDNVASPNCKCMYLNFRGLV